MENTRTRMAIGALLVGAAILVLLQNLGVLRTGLDLLWAICFLLAGAIFTSVFLATSDTAAAAAALQNLRPDQRRSYVYQQVYSEYAARSASRCAHGRGA